MIWLNVKYWWGDTNGRIFKTLAEIPVRMSVLFTTYLAWTDMGWNSNALGEVSAIMSQGHG